jgi:hypothetical protein
MHRNNSWSAGLGEARGRDKKAEDTIRSRFSYLINTICHLRGRFTQATERTFDLGRSCAKYGLNEQSIIRSAAQVAQKIDDKTLLVFSQDWELASVSSQLVKSVHTGKQYTTAVKETYLTSSPRSPRSPMNSD